MQLPIRRIPTRLLNGLALKRLTLEQKSTLHQGFLIVRSKKCVHPGHGSVGTKGGAGPLEPELTEVVGSRWVGPCRTRFLRAQTLPGLRIQPRGLR